MFLGRLLQALLNNQLKNYAQIWDCEALSLLNFVMQPDYSSNSFDAEFPHIQVSASIELPPGNEKLDYSNLAEMLFSTSIPLVFNPAEV